MHKEEQRAVACSRQSCLKPSTRCIVFLYASFHILILSPVDAERGIGQHEIERSPIEVVFAEGIAPEELLADVMVVAFHQEVSLADGVGLVVKFLPEELHFQVGVISQCLEVFFTLSKHTPRSTTRVVDREDTTWDIEFIFMAADGKGHQ